MLSEWLLAVWLSAAGFAEPFTCTITGYVYGMPEDASDFRRSDGCALIRHEVLNGQLILHSRRYWVRIILPATGGQQAFWYRWGAPVAHVRAQDWPVEWGRVEQG